MSKIWEKVIAEEYVRVYKLDDESYLTDFELNEDGFIHIFKKINYKSKVIKEKKSEYKKYFRRKNFLKMLVLQIQLVEDESYVSKKFFILAEDENVYDDKIKKMNEKIEKDILKDIELNDLTISIRNNINQIKTKLDNLKIEEIEKLNEFDDYLKKVLEGIEQKDFNLDINKKDKILQAIEDKKQSKIKILKEKIDLTLKQDKNISIVNLCKILDVNRKTFYNLKLNEYLKEKNV